MRKRRVCLTEKYRPRKVEDFVGLPKTKAVVSNFLHNPYPAVFLFIGESGVGKTALALAMADALHSLFCREFGKRRAGPVGNRIGRK
jgi:DNA polymerase III gamma/tau subunit